MEASNKLHQTLAPQHSNTQEVHALGLGNQALVVPLSHQFLDDSSCRDLVPNLARIISRIPRFPFQVQVTIGTKTDATCTHQGGGMWEEGPFRAIENCRAALDKAGTASEVRTPCQFNTFPSS